MRSGFQLTNCLDVLFNTSFGEDLIKSSAQLRANLKGISKVAAIRITELESKYPKDRLIHAELKQLCTDPLREKILEIVDRFEKEAQLHYNSLYYSMRSSIIFRNLEQFNRMDIKDLCRKANIRDISYLLPPPSRCTPSTWNNSSTGELVITGALLFGLAALFMAGVFLIRNNPTITPVIPLFMGIVAIGIGIGFNIPVPMTIIHRQATKRAMPGIILALEQALGTQFGRLCKKFMEEKDLTMMRTSARVETYLRHQYQGPVTDDIVPVPQWPLLKWWSALPPASASTVAPTVLARSSATTSVSSSSSQHALTTDLRHRPLPYW